MQLVEHRIYGKGRILKKRYGGFDLRVEFEDGIERWVRRDEVRFLSERPILVKHKHTKRIFSEKQFKARQIIEALRLGVVPHKYVEEFTFGREGEIKQIKNWLDNPSDGSLALIGEYGAGKTHLLEYIYSFALNNNWAVSIVELDPNEAPFHKPKVVYQKTISSFRFKSQNGGFREFLREISINPNHSKINEHQYLGRIIKDLRSGDENENLLEWIEGASGITYPIIDKTDKGDITIEKKGSWTWVYGKTFPIKDILKKDGFKWSKKRRAWYKLNKKEKYLPLPETSTSANVYCYILSGIGWTARNILGLKGLLVLFDEAESIDSYWYTSYQNNKAWNFLTGLILMTNNDKRLLTDTIERRYTWSGHSQGLWGGYTALQYCGHSHLPHLPFIWKIPCYVKIIFTFTSIPDIEPLNNLSRFELEHLDNESLMKISETIITLYQRAYNFKPDRNPFDLIPRDKTRLFIKGMIEALDLMCFHSDRPVEELLR